MLDPDDEVVIKDAKEGGAVLITWDRVVRKAAGGLTPYEMLDKALDKAKTEGAAPEAVTELHRLHQLSPIELTKMREGADETVAMFRQHIQIGRDTAKLVRQLRVDEDYSWRAIARWASALLGAPWGANQLAGLVICEKAAKSLGEDFLKPPWN